MKPPYWWWHRNIAFGSGGSEDPWALFRVETESYEGKSVEGKSELLWALAGALYALESDVQLLRVSRPWSIDDYLDGARTTLDARHGHAEAFDAHLLDCATSDDEHAPARPEVYLAPRLPRQATLARLGASLGGEGSLAARARAALTAVGLLDPRAHRMAAHSRSHPVMPRLPAAAHPGIALTIFANVRPAPWHVTTRASTP